MPFATNIAGEYITSALFEAQEIYLKNIIGGRLLRSLKKHEDEHDWDDFPAYADLKEMAQPFIIYQGAICLFTKVAYKVANIGVYTTEDQNVKHLSKTEISELKEEYQAKADFFCHELQKWLCHYKAQFAELNACDCGEAAPDLRDMSIDTGVFLDGPRGQRLPGDNGCC